MLNLPQFIGQRRVEELLAVGNCCGLQAGGDRSVKSFSLSIHDTENPLFNSTVTWRAACYTLPLSVCVFYSALGVAFANYNLRSTLNELRSDMISETLNIQSIDNNLQFNRTICVPVYIASSAKKHHSYLLHPSFTPQFFVCCIIYPTDHTWTSDNEKGEQSKRALTFSKSSGFNRPPYKILPTCVD